MRATAGALFLSCILANPCIATAHEEDGPALPVAEQLGRVDFQVSCNEAAQREFNRAMALYHSFWFDPATDSFKKVLAHDPDCAMAYWGLAFSTQLNPFAGPPPDAVKVGAQYAEQAVRLNARTQRERDYIAALQLLFKDHETAGLRQRTLAWEQGMERVARNYPDDKEAQILYALSLAVNAPPTDKTFAKQLKAGAILETLELSLPQHPGIAHYLIHTYDFPGLVERGLPAARRYAAIAPAAPHAQHMPAHIFSRLGLWDESIRTNAASVKAAEPEYRKGSPVGIAYTYHASDYMTYAYLQRGQDRLAREIVDRINAVQKVEVAYLSTPYAFAAIPARYSIELRRWNDAAALPLRDGLLPWDSYPQARAVTLYARALGTARSNRPDDARREISALRNAQSKMREMKQDYWADQAEIQILAASAWVAFAEGQREQAVTLMRKAADMESATDKHPVTPGLLVPARELLGEMLLELGRPAEALIEFEQVLLSDPNRFRGFYNTALAAERAGDVQKARTYYDRLLQLAVHDSSRPELTHARSLLAARQ